MNYTLDKTAAEKFGNSNPNISESGKYTGTIDTLEYHENPSTGSRGLMLSFTADSGASCRIYINTHYRDKNGQDIQNIENISALLAVLRQRETGNHVLTPVKVWNNESRQHDTLNKPCYAALHGKRIGLLLRAEQYTYTAGGLEKDGIRMNILQYFEADTEFTPAEILSRATEPKELGRRLAWLAEHPVKDNRQKRANTPPPAPPQAGDFQAAPKTNDLNDDIPF